MYIVQFILLSLPFAFIIQKSVHILPAETPGENKHIQGSVFSHPVGQYFHIRVDLSSCTCFVNLLEGVGITHWVSANWYFSQSSYYGTPLLKELGISVTCMK